MRIFSSKRDFGIVGSVFLPLLVFFAAVTMLLYGFSNTDGSTEKKRAEVTYNAVRRAVVSCYALEGFYPASVAYLEENYGVKIDRNKFVVEYETIGSNIMPAFQVIPKGSGDESW